MPRIIIVAGPNGAGKTTFANEYLSEEEKGFTFVNADEIGRELADQPGTGAFDIRAGRIMLDRIDELSHAGADFVVETTLATLAYARKIPVWRREGYSVSLIYVRLGSVAESMARVSKRVRAGGHGIPEEAIRRRFGKSLVYLQTIYKPIVDSTVYRGKPGRQIHPRRVMGTIMTKGLDVAKMEAAFKRAAHKAVHGTREERAGKFIPGNERPTASQSKRRHPQSSKTGRRSSQA